MGNFSCFLFFEKFIGHAQNLGGSALSKSGPDPYCVIFKSVSCWAPDGKISRHTYPGGKLSHVHMHEILEKENESY